MDSSVVDIFKNVTFWSSFCAWMVAQFTKMLCGFSRTKKFDFRYFVSTGGMPSAHSAMMCGLAAAVGFNAGFHTPVFAVSMGIAIIVMFDASTVRRAAGQQARILNEMMQELFKEHHLSERKLAELLGHTRFEVFMGMIVGILVAMLVNAVAILF